MGHNNKTHFNHRFASDDHPFPQPNAHRKHTYRQVNGETQEAQNIIILHRQTRKRS